MGVRVLGERRDTMRARLAAALACAVLLALALTSSRVSGSTPAALGPFSSQESGLGVEYQLSQPSNPATNNYKPASVYNTQAKQTLVVWHRNTSTTYELQAALLDLRGDPLGNPVTIISGGTPVYQPAVAYNATSNQYLIVWMNNTSLDGKTYAIWGKILSASLSEVKAAFPISPDDPYAMWSPRTA